MTRKPSILITGANGEVGHGLITYLASQPDTPDIITLDLNPLDAALKHHVATHYQGDILNETLLEKLHCEYEIDTIFHLAALLSTSAEKNPALAHDVNVNGTVKLFEMAIREGQSRNKPVKFIYPSSIAVYGVPDLTTKMSALPLTEESFLMPITMYGANKLYCEHLGRYYSQHYGQLTSEKTIGLDFRAVRFPGLISAHTVPSGGTSDFGPEMIHAAAKGDAYACFVREDAALPFMTMPDAIQALIKLAQAPRELLTRHIYNVTSFSLSASDFAKHVETAFSGATITYNPDSGRQGIVDTWPRAIDDSAARMDWGWSPVYTLEDAFDGYIIKHIRAKYAMPQLS